MEKKTVNILGTEYTISDDLKSEENDGITRIYKKEIKVRPKEDMLESDCTEEEKLKAQKESIRHELFHCFFYEGTGMAYTYDENLINFLAVNSPKIFQLFQKLDIL